MYQWVRSVAWNFLFLAGSVYGSVQYAVPPQPDNYIRDLIEEKVDLILNNLSDKELARLLKPYRDELVREVLRECEQVDCQPGQLTFEEAIAAILKWQGSHLGGINFGGAGAPVSAVTEAALLASPMMPDRRDSCAAIVEGEISMEYGFFKERKVQVFVKPELAKKKQGPVVFFWHGSNEDWGQVYRVLGESVINQITKEGGVVFAPFAGSPDALPWHVMNPALVWKHNDFQLADQLVACAEEEFDINDRRIYSMGFSAGGIQSAAMGRMRSNYIAAIASYSGGQLPWFKLLPTGAPNNYYPAFVTYGTKGQDKVPLVEFSDTSKKLIFYMENRGFHKAIDCEQNRGHTMPSSTKQVGWDYISKVTYSRVSGAWVEKGGEAKVEKRSGDRCL
ncbi:hypothetical protein [Parendozoicomonas sp. Alg238-R29]|uniref:hypothetical protein n=1 Tax=Parendozoicomonas sp. Alg238-R29 TaxID=2993446 RepID=UPI00248D4A49|nr:hypothetical protein [Parendozoicomonas sp. Alg238-R29]